MKPPSFDYAAPKTLDEAVALLGQHEGEAKILAGGQSLMPLLNMRLARPGLLVDIARVDGLDHIREVDGCLAIGSMTRQRAVEHSELVRRRFPLLHTAIRHIAHPQNRNQGTVGGSLAHADPAAELPAIAVAVDAEFRAVGPSGERRIKAADFFVTYLTTALEPTEVLTEVRFPALPPRTGWSFIELARRHGDFALTGVVARLATDGGGRCSAARIVLFGVGTTPVRASGAEQVLIGEQGNTALFERAGQVASQEIEEPLSDVHASAEYRRDLARVLTRRALAEAASSAAAGG
jgi:CO/xanthine dehydrogenase FAD-binding subunit